MKQNNLLTTMLLLFALIVGSMSAWATDPDVTYDFTGSDWSVNNGTLTDGTVSFTGAGANFKMNSGYFMLGKSGAYLNFPTYTSAVEKIVITGRSGASGSVGQNIYVGDVEVSDATTGATGTNTYEIASGYQAAGTQYTLKVTTAHNTQITKIEVYFASSSTPTCVAPTFNPAAGTFTSTQNVTISTATEGATIYYTIDGNNPTTSSNVYTSAISVSTTTTIKAIAVKDGMGNSAIVSATYTIVNLDHAGTAEDPYSVEDAIKAIDAEVGTSDVYVRGIVSTAATSLSSGALSYYISDDGTTTNEFEIYKGKGINGANFTSTDDVQVGDVVVVTGDIYYFSQQGIYEFRQGSKLVSLIRPADTTPRVTVASNSVEVDANGGDGTITVTCANLGDNPMLNVAFYESNGTTSATYDWVDAEIDNEGNVYYVIGANEGAARTAYLKVYGTDGTNEAYSDLITITQDAYEAPAVPGSWVAAGLADINANDVFVIVGDNGDTYAMSNDKGASAAPEAVAVTVVDNTLFGEVAANIQWNISGDATDGYTFYPNGDDENWLYCTNSNNGVRVGTGDAKHFTQSSGYLTTTETTEQRYIGIYSSQNWRCYTSINSNIKEQTFTFYKKLAAKLNDYGYATFSAIVPVDFSEATDYTAWVVSSISGTAITFEQVTGAVAANTGVLLKGTAGSTVYPVAAATGTPVTNKLEAITTATPVNEGDYYGLSGNTFVPVGAGTIPAGKALLPATEVSGARQLTFVFGSETTGIRNLTPTLSEGKGVYYNLAGQRVAQPTKGLYIVNGKKYMVK